MLVTVMLRFPACRPSVRAVLHCQRRFSKIQASPALSERVRVFESLRERQGQQSTSGATKQAFSVRLADGRTVNGTTGVTTPSIIAQNSCVKGALVCRVNGELWELLRPLEADCELQLLGFNTTEGKQAVWRTGACVVGWVLERVFGVEVCREGVSESGLYCDHLLENSALSLAELEERCKEAAGQKLPLSRLELNRQEVTELFQDNALRLQLIEEQMSGPTVTVYRCGDSIGVCNGPLLPNTGLLKVFKMLQVSPVTLTNPVGTSGVMRVIGVAFPGEREREEWEREQEETRKRDHRRIGKDQELFFFNDVSPGSCFFLPKGAHIYNTLADFIKLEEEIIACLDFVRSVYRVFGFSFHCLLSTRPTPCLGEPALWDHAEQQLERSLQQFGERWQFNPGDGAFYGPKIDIQIKDAIGRQHQCATIQLDFQLPIRFDLQYVGGDGETHRPVMVHRAVLGSLERMIAILAENFSGKWPLWLSPAQVMIIPVGGGSESYAQQVVRQFREVGFMADADDDHGATLNKKIRSAQLAQYNYIFVVGEKECVSGTVSVRTRGGKQLGRRPTEEVLASLTHLRDARSNQDDF
ncbi:threonine--tRNA ligase 1, cytoplasmic-like isoform X2 [Oncorhynchus clarkii lewisi]|uniref:threonine--tRNA ligase 1, cytoplasmic-like isoform X2 n=1 Tax=Oncorhynchus clarkii lewisi TaxID=490388 RepID=UPI0039B8BC89